MANHGVNISITTPIGTLGNTQTLSYTGTASIDAEAVPIATDTLYNIAFPYATMKSLVIFCTCSCTIETNHTAAVGGDTLAITANVPFIWQSTMNQTKFPNPLSADVTKIYVTAAATGVLSMAVLYDSTP